LKDLETQFLECFKTAKRLHCKTPSMYSHMPLPPDDNDWKSPPISKASLDGKKKKKGKIFY